MDKYLNLKLVQGNKTLDLKDKYKIIDIEGIDFPELELNTSSNAHYDGSIVDSKRVDKRYISIQAEYKGPNKEIERKNLISFFNPKNKGILIIDYCGTLRSIEYEIEEFNSKIVNIHEDLIFMVNLLCANPYFNEVMESKIEIALWNGAFHFPLVIPKNNGIIVGFRSPSLIVNVNNTGDVQSGMIIEFRALGSLTNPSLFNINSRESIKINKSMVSGEIIKVNTSAGKKKVVQKLNGVEANVMNLLDLNSEFLQLSVGDNLFRYNADSNIDNLEVSIYYNPAYLGV
ncbi:MAG: phage tail family protein [Clostridium sp.]|uniref:phage tail family protein n=1 Tax=Clostridium sp. TaxID=1506 RepID=UPI0030514C37